MRLLPLNRGPLARRRVIVAVSLTLGSAMLAGGSGASSAGATPFYGARDAFAADARAGGVRALRPGVRTEYLLALLDSLRGRSGKLRVGLVARSSSRAALLARVFGDSALGRLGIHDVRDSIGSRGFAVITIRDFADKLDGKIGAYRIGFWPAESRALSGERYGNPAGFIEVTRDNLDTPVSEHFRLGDFLTHDQPDVWPKYLVLREPLVDKLELVIAELERAGHPVRHMHVMSGFRTPAYNATGGETGGRASRSRHMYGDAADVFVDNDGDGRMDDLNGDGRVDHRDAQVILDAVERAERRHPDLLGGVGVYHATASHGPFAHVDARGYRARWGLI